MLLAIDPGTTQSAWVIMDNNYRPLEFSITENNELLNSIRNCEKTYDCAAIEMIVSYGMKVGATVLDTCVWIGRFSEALDSRSTRVEYLSRMDVKMNLCKSSRANDSNIMQALIDRFGDKGTKKSPGWFYGFKKDIWAAYAVGVTYFDSAAGR